MAVMLAEPIPNAHMDAFQRAMDGMGYVEGKNVQIRYRSVEGHPERYPALAAEMVKLKPDVIVTGGGTPAVRAARQATSTIPIVFPALADPIATGAVDSLTHPGGNITGLSMLDIEIAAKRVQLAKELFPTLRRLAVLWDSNSPVRLDAVEKAARTLGVEMQSLSAAAPEGFEPAFDAAKKANAGVMMIMPSAFFATQRRKLTALAAQKRLPTIYEHRQFTAAGGLMSYGPDVIEMYRGAARYVDRILKGAKPADLPVEQASKYELVINRRTAAALGVKIPGALLVRADQIIE